MKNKNWKDKLINLINKISKKKGWRCDDLNPYFYQIDLLPYSNAKTLREYKQQQKASK
jgi:hypothetical protein